MASAADPRWTARRKTTMEALRWPSGSGETAVRRGAARQTRGWSLRWQSHPGRAATSRRGSSGLRRPRGVDGAAEPGHKIIGTNIRRCARAWERDREREGQRGLAVSSESFEIRPRHRATPVSYSGSVAARFARVEEGKWRGVRGLYRGANGSSNRGLNGAESKGEISGRNGGG